MTSEMLYNYVTCFKNAFLISGDLRLSCVQISLISDTGPIFAIREPCPFRPSVRSFVRSSVRQHLRRSLVFSTSEIAASLKPCIVIVPDIPFKHAP